MNKPELISAIMKLDPEARKARLGKTAKVALEARLAELRGGEATPASSGDHDWRLMFEESANDHWSGPDSGRWCGTCGESVRSLSATRDASPCAGKPADRTLTIKALKKFRGTGGAGFNATLYEDGKKIGLVINEGRGGCYRYIFDVALGGYKKELELDCWARVKLQKGMEALDIFVGDLVDAEDERRWLQRHTKDKTLVKLKGHGPGEWTTYSKRYSVEFAADLRERHGDELVEIGNEREGVA